MIIIPLPSYFGPIQLGGYSTSTFYVLSESTLIFIPVFPAIHALAFFRTIGPLAFIFLVLFFVKVHPNPIFLIVFPFPFIIVPIIVCVFAMPVLETSLNFPPVEIAVVEQIGAGALNAIILPLPGIDITLLPVAYPISISSRVSDSTHILHTLFILQLFFVLLLLYEGENLLLYLLLKFLILVAFDFCRRFTVEWGWRF